MFGRNQLPQCTLACQQSAVHASSLLRSRAYFSPEDERESLQRLLTFNELFDLTITEVERLEITIKHGPTVMIGLLVQINSSDGKGIIKTFKI